MIWGPYYQYRIIAKKVRFSNNLLIRNKHNFYFKIEEGVALDCNVS